MSNFKLIIGATCMFTIFGMSGIVSAISQNNDIYTIDFSKPIINENRKGNNIIVWILRRYLMKSFVVKFIKEINKK